MLDLIKVLTDAFLEMGLLNWVSYVSEEDTYELVDDAVCLGIYTATF